MKLLIFILVFIGWFNHSIMLHGQSTVKVDTNEVYLCAIDVITLDKLRDASKTNTLALIVFQEFNKGHFGISGKPDKKILLEKSDLEDISGLVNNVIHEDASVYLVAMSVALDNKACVGNLLLKTNSGQKLIYIYKYKPGKWNVLCIYNSRS